jgi:hypothetical protein
MVLSTGFALVRARESQNKHDKTAIFTIPGVLRKKLQAETMRRGGLVQGQPLRVVRGLGRVPISRKETPA